MSASPEDAARDPFGLTANPDGYFPTAAIERVLADALAALADGNVPVIAGPPGLGKTLVLQLLARAREPEARAIYIPFCTLPPEDLARLALGLLGTEAGADPEAEFLARAQRSAREGKLLLLLIDDAAALPGETAAQLASWLISSGGALQIVLAGLPGPALRHARDAFGDRAEDLVLVSGLRPEEVRGYVHTRLASVGASSALRAAFDDAALAELARASEGNPRRMNLGAQAIMRSVRANAGAAAAPALPAADAQTARARASADDLVSVGEYRFVRGRFVDPETGAAHAHAPPTVPHVEKTTTPLPPRRARRAPAYTPPLEIDRGPEHAEDPWLEVDEEAVPAVAAEPQLVVQPPVVVHPPVRASRRRVPLLWIAGGIGLLAFAVGAWWQLGNRDEVLTARVTVEPVQIGRTAAPDDANAVPPDGATAADGGSAAAPETPVVPDATEVVRREDLVLGSPQPSVPPLAELESAGNAPPAAIVTPAPSEPSGAVAPLPPAVPPPATTAAVAPASPSSPAAAPGAVTPAPAPPPPAEMVAVAINATPWAVIEVDGKEIGETPLAGVKLEVGRHLFRARMPDGSVRERAIRVDADNTTVVFE